MEFSQPLSRILRNDYGFMIYKGSPTEEDKEEYKKVCQLLGRSNIPFTPLVPIYCERKLSFRTSMIIESKIERNSSGARTGVFYDLYKASFFYGNDLHNIKVYVEHATRKELLRCLNRQFQFLRTNGTQEKDCSEPVS